MKGKLITFEGTEGCGKTTQIMLLKDYLYNKNYNVLNYREPRDTKIGEEIREILLKPEHYGILNEQTELLLFEASRSQLTYEFIKPGLESGDIIILDRFFDSSTAYQGRARKLGVDKVEDFNMFATQGIIPDITFLLDLPIELGLQRVEGELDRIEREKIEFHNLVRESYIALAEKYPDRIKVIDTEKNNVEETHSIVVNYIDELF